ncbi:MAG TPA: hypothetical protein VFE25_09825 [Opitutaceae bacterium]|jgi:hypothetical protein|nr:hypothetical protein [Opitutaceae bacterium]
MKSARSATILALTLGALAASAQDTSSNATISSDTRAALSEQPVPTPSMIAAGQFPVAPPAVPNLEGLAGNPGEPIGSKDLSRFEEPQKALAQANSNIMSRYEVRADRIPEFRLRDVYTTEGLVDYSFRTHPGLRVGNFNHSNSAQAYEMYLEDERLANIGDLVDTALAITVGGDKKEGDLILKEERNAYMRDEHTDPLQSWEDAPKTRAGTPLIVDFQEMQVNWLYVKF